MEKIPLYTKSPEYAIEHDEQVMYRASRDVTFSCKEAMAGIINDYYKDYSLDCEGMMNELSTFYSADRINHVLAVTIISKKHDDRISQDNKDWAEETLRDCYYNKIFVINNIHAGLLNMLADHVRESLEQDNSPSM